MGKVCMVILAITMAFTTCDAQFGLRSGYVSMRSESGLESSLSPHHAMQLGVNYWYRLKNHRVEFFPEIHYQRSLEANIAQSLSDQVNKIGFQLPVQVYPFDFISDCTCPTFSKQSRIFQKGFFLFASGGYLWGDVASPTAGGGVGFDLGISDLFTLSLLTEYRRYFQDVESTIALDRAWIFGLRASFRPDYKRSF